MARGQERGAQSAADSTSRRQQHQHQQAAAAGRVSWRHAAWGGAGEERSSSRCQQSPSPVLGQARAGAAVTVVLAAAHQHICKCAA